MPCAAISCHIRQRERRIPLSERLLRYLAEHNLLSAEQIERLRNEHQKSGRSVRELLDESGLLTEEQLLEALADVSGLPTVRLYEQQIPADVLKYK